MPDLRRYYLEQLYTCPECRGALRYDKRRDSSDALVLVHGASSCSRAGKMYYAPVITLEPFSYELAGVKLAPHECPHGKSADDSCKGCGRLSIREAAAPTPSCSFALGCGTCRRCLAAAKAIAAVDGKAPAFEDKVACPCGPCRKAREEDAAQAAAAARRRPPFETFKGATCKGSYSLGSACGRCERCVWERKQMGDVVI